MSDVGNEIGGGLSCWMALGEERKRWRGKGKRGFIYHVNCIMVVYKTMTWHGFKVASIDTVDQAIGTLMLQVKVERAGGA